MNDSKQRSDEIKVITKADKVKRLRSYLQDKEDRSCHDFPVVIPPQK